MSNPKYLNKVMLTKQKIADHEYTVLYDRQGNKYLKLETFHIENTKPKLDFDVSPEIELSRASISTAFWGFKPNNSSKGEME